MTSASRLLSPAATRPNPGLELSNAQQLRQLGDIDRNAPRLSEELAERHWRWLAGTGCQ